MKLSRLLALSCTTLIIVLVFVSSSSDGAKHRKLSNRRNRQMIIDCCGRDSCSESTEKSQTSLHSNATNKNVATAKGALKTTTSTEAPVEEETVPDESTTAEILSSQTPLVTAAAPVATSAAAPADTTTAPPSGTSSSDGPTTAGPTTLETTTSTLTTETMTTPEPTTTTTTTPTTTTPTTTTEETTTTTPPIILTGEYCVFRGCPYHPCPIDPIMQKTMLAGTNSSDGAFFSKCGKKYLFSSVKKTRYEAAMLCCKYNMRLASVETDDEQLCLTNLNNDVLKNSGTTFWTSGITDPYCPSVWCPNVNNYSTPITSVINRVQTAPTKITDKCNSFVLTAGDDSKSGLKFSDCNAPLNFICESYEPACPNECTKDTSLYNSRGNVIDPLSYGNWINSCNFTFLFGTNLGSWQDNWNTCCQLGMSPFVLDQAQEFACFENLLKGWQYNLNYWTDGSRLDSPTNPKWCSLKKFVGNLTLEGQNNASYVDKDCIGLQITKTTNNITSYFSSSLGMRNCSARQMIACRGPATPKPCNRPFCPRSCPKNASLFESGGKLKYATTYGRWTSKCQKYYMFTEKTANGSLSWQDAKCKCESIGMKLVSPQTLTQVSCLDNITREGMADLQGSYWTGGSFLDCDDQFSWCTLEEFFNSSTVRWGANQPPLNKVNTCVRLTLTATVSYLQTASCDEKANYICEMDDTNGDSLTAARSQLCQKAFNVSDADLQTVFTATSFSTSLKCYFKCMGEKMGLVKNGLPVGKEVLKLVEANSKNSDAMQDSFDIFDVCKNKNSGGCEAIAQAFQCTAASAPSVVSGMVQDSVKDVSSGAPVSCTNVNCTANPTCTINFDADAAATKCCTLNMTLAYFFTVDQFNCFLAADNALQKTKAGTIFYLGANNIGCISFFGWCPSKRSIPALQFMASSNTTALTNRCLGIKANSTMFSDKVTEIKCTGLYQFICTENA
ncbi:uncharacterized protein LOC132202576 isoform X2 [Neocloeon triangulifer]|uniref:uncharacterized protein LOC132202576 isoform X2 n=1 Tax=Neocloeon triangulifer TaxID=2078957 RepID=UPI00286ED02A|nr:uncharacterized protein LOC132202576 isoform X2 [Neocloeon triangulifer]